MIHLKKGKPRDQSQGRIQNGKKARKCEALIILSLINSSLDSSQYLLKLNRLYWFTMYILLSKLSSTTQKVNLLAKETQDGGK